MAILDDVTVHLSTEQDGNVYMIMGTITRAIRRAGHSDRISEFVNDITSTTSYDQALQHIMEWVNVT
jgi:hypothetical protein